MRAGAGLLLVLAGMFLLVPASAIGASSPLVSGGNRMLGQVSGDGAGGQFVIGGLLGLVWAPCVGPTPGVAIAAASRGENLAGVFLIFLVFGAGVATMILAFAYGSRKALGARKAGLQKLARDATPGFAAALLLVAS